MRIITYHDLISLLAYKTPLWASLVAGVLVVFTLSLSMYLVFEHLSAYKNPEVFLIPCHTVVDFLDVFISVLL